MSAIVDWDRSEPRKDEALCDVCTSSTAHTLLIVRYADRAIAGVGFGRSD